jgi:hypothetical protein
MSLPVRYRVHGESAWSYGMTINVSSSGLLFRSDRGLAPAAELDIEIVLPGDDEGGASVVSHADVVRIDDVEQGAADHVVAATLDDSSLVRERRAIH